MLCKGSARIIAKFKNRFPELAWKKMKAMRNILIRMYDKLNFDIVKDTAIKDTTNFKNILLSIYQILKTKPFNSYNNFTEILFYQNH